MSVGSRNVHAPGAPWFRFFASDWLADTRGLKLTEAGLLVNLIAMMHEAGAPIREDLKRLPRRCGTTRATFEKTLDALLDIGKIVRVEGGLWSREVEHEIEFRIEKSQKAKTSSSKRWQKTQEKQSQSDANGMLTRGQKSDVRGNRPSGGSRSEAREGIEISGPVSAYADRPSIGGDEPPSFYGAFVEPDLEDQPAYVREAAPPADLHVEGAEPLADNDEEHHSMLDRLSEINETLTAFQREASAIMRAKLAAGGHLTAKGDLTLRTIFADVFGEDRNVAWPEDENTSSTTKERHS